MWSLKAGLEFYRNHLPAGFDASHGIASLFPAGYKGSISPLKGYAFVEYARLATPYDVGTEEEYFGSAGDFWAMADGSGHWAWSWNWWPVQTSAGYEREAGFVFNYSDDARAHGYADTSHPAAQTKNCAGGTDEWISQHWPELFAHGARLTLVEGSSPQTSQIWTDAGFGPGQFTALPGGVLACANTITGSTLFHYPNHPLQIPSVAGADLGAALRLARLTIERALAQGVTHAKSVNGYEFTLHYPTPQPGQPTTVTIDVSHPASAIQGTAVWQIKSDGFRVDANVSGPAAGGGQADFTYLLEAEDADLAGDRLTLTATVTDSAGTQSSTTQTIVGMSLRGETTQNTQGGSTQTSTFSIDENGALSIGGTNPPDVTTLGLAALPAQQQLPGIVDGSAGALVAGLAEQIAGTSTAPFTQTYEGGAFGQVTVTGTVLTDSQGNVTGETITAVSSPNASASLTYTYTLDTTNPGNPSSAQGSIVYTPPDGQLTVSWTSGLPGGVPTDTQTTTFTGLDGSSTSQSLTTTDGSVSAQSSTVTDSAGNTSTSTATFTPGGNFQLTITTTDAAGNGTTETITGDSSGNATSDVTTSLGAGATTPLSDGGGESGSGDDEGQDGDGDTDEDGDEDTDGD